MGSFSLWHWLILLAVVLVLFGGSGKISSLMGDVAKGIKSFKKGLAEDEDKAAETAKSIEKDARPGDQGRCQFPQRGQELGSTGAGRFRAAGVVCIGWADCAREGWRRNV